MFGRKWHKLSEWWSELGRPMRLLVAFAFVALGAVLGYFDLVSWRAWGTFLGVGYALLLADLIGLGD